MNIATILRIVFTGLLSISLFAFVPMNAVAGSGDGAQEEQASDKSGNSAKSGKSNKRAKSDRSDKGGKSAKNRKKSGKDKPGLSIKSARYSDKKGELRIKVKSHDLPRHSRIYLYDADTGVLLKSQDTDGKKTEFSITNSFPCSVRVESSGFSDFEEVRGAPGYCGDDGLMLIMEGEATTGSISLAYAEVTAEVEGFTFTTTADVEGYYSLVVRGTQPESLVTLRARGQGEQDWATLFAIAGQLGDPAATLSMTTGERAGLFARIIGSLVQALVPSAHAQITEIEQLTISNITTALYALLTDANGGTPPVTQEELDVLFEQSNPAEVITLAAAISLVTGPADLPAGATGLADVVNDPAVAEDLVASADPTELQTAVEDITGDPDLFPPLAASDILGESYEAEVGNIGPGETAAIMTFDPAGSGSRQNFFGSQPFSWVIDPESRLVITWAQPIEESILPNLPCFPREDAAGNPTDYDCPSLIQSTYSQIATTSNSSAFVVEHAYDYAEPANPGGVIIDTVNLVRKAGLADLDTATLVGREFAGTVGVEMNSQYTTSAQYFSLDAGGVGTLSPGNPVDATIVATPLSWSVVDGKQLSLDYLAPDLNGDPAPFQVTYSILRSVGKAQQAVVEIVYPDSFRQVTSAVLVEPELDGYDAATAPGRYLLVDGPADNSPFEAVFQFNENGTGLQQFYPLGQDNPESDCFEQPYRWNMVDGALIASYYRDLSTFEFLANCPASLEGVTCYTFRTRAFELLAADAEYNYIRNWQTILQPDGSLVFGPYAYVGVQVEDPDTRERCAGPYPDARDE